MSTLTYYLEVVDDAVYPPGQAKTGLTPTWLWFKNHATRADVAGPAISELADGVYYFQWDPETEIIARIDFGAALTFPGNRYKVIELVKDPSRIALIPSAGLPSLADYTAARAAKLDTIETAVTSRLPAALVGGRMDVSVGAMQANVLTAAALATDAVTEIQTGLATLTLLQTIAGYLDTEIASILAAVDTEVAAIKAKTDTLPAQPAAVGDIPTPVENAAALLDAGLSDHVSPGSVGRALQIARAQGAGKWVISNDTLTLYDVDQTTVIQVFQLAPAGGPYVSRTGQAE